MCRSRWLEPPTIPSDLVLRTTERRDKAIVRSLDSLPPLCILAWRASGTSADVWRVTLPLFGIGLVYNTFPLPPAPAGTDATPRAAMRKPSSAARANHPKRDVGGPVRPRPHAYPTFAKHIRSLDRAVDKLYRRSGFASERDRVEHLLGLYEKVVAPVTAMAKPKRRRRRRRDGKE